MIHNIMASFGSSKSCVTASRYRYDYGQQLVFKGIPLPDAYEVHFSNEEGGQAKTMIGDADGVLIPDEYFLTGETIYAWLFLHDEETDGRTMYKVKIPVINKAKPTEVQPTPVEQDLITQAIAALGIAVEKSETNVTHYPKIEGGTWHVWDAVNNDWIDTEIEAQGERGEKGETGADGITPSISIGNVETLEPDEDAYVTRRGTDAEPIFDFGIPKGDKGDDAVIPWDSILPTDTASGEIVTITDGTDLVPAKSLKVALEPIQSGTGTPSPDNVRPISGRTEVVTHVADVLVNDDYAFVYGESLNDTGDFVSGSGYKRTNYIDVSNRNAMTVSVNYASAGDWILRIVGYDSQKQFSELLLKRTIGAAGVYSFNFDISAYSYVAFALVRTGATLEAIADEETYTTALGQTVYGGTLDVVSGELVVDRGYMELSEEWRWIKSSAYVGGYYVQMYATLGYKKNTPFMCSHAKTANALSEYVFGTCYCDQSINFRIMGETSTLQDWKDFIVAQRNSGTPIVICYELATPQTIQLTPQQVQLLLGTNNVWSDGNVTLVYSADIQLYINKVVNA